MVTAHPYRVCLRRAFVLALLIGLAMGVAAGFAAPTPRQLLETPDLSDLAISPDGRSVVWRQMQASVARNHSEATWWVAPLVGSGPPVQVAEGGDAILNFAGMIVEETPQWSPDSRWIYFRALIDGAVGVWRARRDDGAVEAITHDDADVDTFKLSPDGRRLTYTIGATRAAIVQAENTEYDKGVRLDATIDPAQTLIRGAVINGRLATQRITGAWFARSGLLAEQPKRDKTIDLTTLILDAEFSATPPPSPKPTVLDTASLYAVSATDSDGSAVAKSSWDGSHASLRVLEADKPIRLCGDIACQSDQIVAVTWRPNHREVVFTTVDRRRQQTLRRWDLISGRVTRLYASTGVINGGGAPLYACAVGVNTAVCVEAAALALPRLVAVKLDTGQAHSIADPGRSNAEDNDLADDVEVWQDKDGHRFVGHLLRSRTAQGPLPLVINYYHCDGYLKGGFGNEWPLAPLAAAGVATLCIEMAPVTLPANSVAMYQTAVAGIGTIIDRLSERGLIDPKRVCMSGLSFGSEVTMFVAMHSDRLACLSVASPQVSPVYYWMNGLEGRDNHQTLRAVWGLGAPEETPERWKMLSPAMGVDAFRMPLLLQMSEQEYRWEIDFLSRLSASKTPNETWIFADEMHQKAEPRHKLAVYERNLDWFRFWLQGYVDPDPSKAEQYRRWSAKAVAGGIRPGSGQRATLQDLTQTSTLAH